MAASVPPAIADVIRSVWHASGNPSDLDLVAHAAFAQAGVRLTSGMGAGLGFPCRAGRRLKPQAGEQRFDLPFQLGPVVEDAGDPEQALEVGDDRLGRGLGAGVCGQFPGLG
jgi:hypothetical protein